MWLLNWQGKKPLEKQVYSDTMKNTTSIKKRLKEGETIIGTWCLIPSPHVINILANSGLDFVLIDMEHGPINITVASEMVLATEEKCDVLIRVPKNDPAHIQYVLDIGSCGVVIPHIKNVEDRKKAVSYVKYPPIGDRGFSPYTKAGNYTNKTTHTRIHNENTITAIMIEDKHALDNLDQIIDDENVDIVYIGTYDLSVALGIPGDVSNPKVLSELEKAVKTIHKKGKIAGCMAHNKADLDKFKQLGITFVLFKVDTSIISDAIKKIKTEDETA